MQADIFNATIRKLKHEEGPSMGAAMIATYGLQWFESFDECVDKFIDIAQTFEPDAKRHNMKHIIKYIKIFTVIRIN